MQRTPVRVPRNDDDLITKLCKIRGIKDVDRFINPDKSDLHDYNLLNNIRRVADRINQAIKWNDKIVILSDCDTDGVCSTAIMYNYLLKITENVSYVYNQRSKGHGLEQSLHLIPEDTQLLIIVDSSTSSADACKELWDKGMAIIILDHHPAERENPYALIVNPQLDKYPNKQLSGAGVCWKAIQAIDERYKVGTDEFVDLAGVGIHSDQMSMLERENRYIVDQTLLNLNNEGLRAIMRVAKRDVNKMAATDIAFTIAPKINGVTRMDKIELALQLLTCINKRECTKIARQIEEMNEESKQQRKEMMESLLPQIDSNNKIIVAINNDVNKGYSGLIAQELTSYFKRPAMVLNESETGKSLQGSFRTYNGFDIKTYLSNFPQWYVMWTAGHSGAGGLGIVKKNLDKLLNEINSSLKEDDFEQKIEYDLEFNADEITESDVKEISRFARLSGNGCPAPMIRVNNIFTVEKSLIGSKLNTVRVECDEDLVVMKFRTDKAYYDEFPEFKSISVVGTLNLNEFWRWKPEKKLEITKQIFIEDYKIV